MNTKKLEKYGIVQEKGRKYENIIYVMALIYNKINLQVERYFEPYCLTASKFNMLMLAAYQNEGAGLSQVQIAKSMISSAGNVTKGVDSLVKQNLLTRKQNPNSRRENIICITPKGQKLVDTVWPGYNRLVKELTDKIDSNKQPIAEEILNTWLDQLQEEK